MQQKPNPPSIEAKALQQEEDDDVCWLRHNLSKLPDIVIYSWGIPPVILVIVTLTQAQGALAWIEVGCAIAAAVSIWAIIYGRQVCKKN